ncbi:hypothetical protein ACFFQW_30225 [Umezawaea endophytica]|uniref:Uncharacterized protein n=1 Tax=Umezawaea endophytica TaxID=1654476 RepID=A0A9X2VQD8_9PSEU|nr:hypothetical protein [Umezawaea endophytica]MCS7480262.1 hypothetical protein [Umezawaea endophytica]
MTDLDALRSALHGSPAESGTVDVAAVMRSGRRIRTRRRLVRGGGVVSGTAALLVAIFVIGQPGTGTAPEQQPLIEITAAKPADPNSIPVGNVVMTGFDNEVLYFVAGYREPYENKRSPTVATDPDRPALPTGTGYGLTLGNNGVGRIIPLQTTGAAGRWTGFHSITTRGLDGTLDAGNVGGTRLYGYYEGDVRRIVLELDDEVVATARTAKWSADGTITIFWFAPEDIPSDEALHAFRLLAYDQNGQLMPY